MASIRDLDSVTALAKNDFKENSIPVILSKYPNIDQRKLTAISEEFFDVFCDLNQIQIASIKDRKSNKDKSFNGLLLDTVTQWQYYTAYFYKKLAEEKGLECFYAPKELEFLRLEISFTKDESLGLGHKLAEEVLGSIIRQGMNTIKKHFGEMAIFTNNLIPELNKLLDSQLIHRGDEALVPAQSAAAPPLAQARVPIPLARGVSA